MPLTTRASAVGRREFICLIAMVQALQALAIDAMLPALGIMAQDLGARDPNERQLVLGIFILASGLGSLIPGALADRFGRRPVLLICLVSYVLINLASALVQDYPTLLVLRAMLGLSASGLAVLPIAIIRDRFEGDAMARLQSMIGMIFMLVPLLAPSLGQIIMDLVGWRWIFGFMALFGAAVALWAWFRLEETLHGEFRQTVQPLVILNNMGMAMRNRGAIGYVLGTALAMGGNLGYLNSSQQLLTERFGAGQSFPLIFSSMAIFMAVASFTNSRIVERFGARRVSHTALLFYIVVSALQLWLAQDPRESLLEFAVLMSLNLALMGFIGANFGSIALQPFAQIAGAAASIHTFVRLSLAALIGSLIGQSYDGSTRPLAASLLALGTMCLLLVLYSEKGRLFRRLNPPKKRV